MLKFDHLLKISPCCGVLLLCVVLWEDVLPKLVTIADRRYGADIGCSLNTNSLSSVENVHSLEKWSPLLQLSKEFSLQNDGQNYKNSLRDLHRVCLLIYNLSFFF